VRTSARNGGILGLSNDVWSQGAKGIYVSDGRLKLDVGWVGASVVEEPRLDDGEWHHVALVVEQAPGRTEAYHLYVDGVRRKSGEIAFYRFDARGPAAQRQEFRIGHLAIGDAGPFKGEMDDVAAWTRALSAGEVNLIYAAARKPRPEGLASVLDVRNVSPHEPGVRLRLYWLGEPARGMPALRAGQSPNVDRTVASFAIDDGDARLTDDAGERYRTRYVVQLTATLAAPQAGAYQFRVGGQGRARLSVAGSEIVRPGGGAAPREGQIELSAGPHAVVLEQYVEEGGQRLTLEWKPPGAQEFAAVPGDRCRAERFYFRPTNAGRKLLESEGARPGNGRKLAGVHPAYRLTTIRPPGVEIPVGGLAVLPDGRLAVGYFDARKLRAPRPQPEPDGALWVMEGVYGDDPRAVKYTAVADGLFEPAGVCAVGDAIYLSQRDNVLKFTPDGRGGYARSVVASGWETNDFHALCFGLIHQPGGGGGHPGYLYLARSAGLGLAINPPNHGSVWKVDLSKPAGQNVEALTGGHRTPNGIGWGPEGEIYVTDNQGEWTPSNELNRIVPGSFYGYVNPTRRPGAHPSPFVDRPPTPPAVHLPQDEIGNSPTEPILVPPGQPYAGQMLVGDMRYGGINRIFLEKVEGHWQGAAFRFTQGLEGGPNRLAWGRGGTLFVGCIGGQHASTWNWIDPAGRETFQGLQRMTPTGASAFDIHAVRATPDGFEIEFTKPADARHVAGAGNYTVRQWTYVATANYGGPKRDLEELAVASAVPSADGRRVRIAVPGLKEGRVVYVKTDPPAADAEQLWSTETWYSLHRIPLATPAARR